MREYETMLILKPNLGEEKYQKLTEDFKGSVTNFGGSILKFEDMGEKELTKTCLIGDRGRYWLVEFQSGNEALDEMNHRMKVNENFLRHMTVKIESVRSSKKEKTEDVES